MEPRIVRIAPHEKTRELVRACLEALASLREKRRASNGGVYDRVVSESSQEFFLLEYRSVKTVGAKIRALTLGDSTPVAKVAWIHLGKTDEGRLHSILFDGTLVEEFEALLLDLAKAIGGIEKVLLTIEESPNGSLPLPASAGQSADHDCLPIPDAEQT